MTFIRGHVDPSKGEQRYNRIGYSRNPFPTQGEVSADVFVERPELNELQRDLTAFLSGKRQGRVWALSGAQGLGKSNFLRFLAREFADAQSTEEITNTGVHLFRSQALSPAHLVEGMMAAIQTERVRDLCERKPSPPSGFEETDFGRFWKNVSSEPAAVAASFFVRWITGQQTYKAERDPFGINAREKLAPAVAIPYLRALVDMMDEADTLSRIVLLLDEFEDVQALSQAKQSEYIQMLKTLLNAFNWRGLYIIIAGAPSAFTAIAEKLPSLAARWTSISLLPVGSTDEAVDLANEYKQAFTLKKNKTPQSLRPTEDEIKGEFIRIFSERRLVTQRALLTALHALLENLVDRTSG